MCSLLGFAFVEVLEHVLGAVDVGAEREVVNFPGVSFVKVLSYDEVKHLLLVGADSEVLKDTLELLRRHMA